MKYKREFIEKTEMKLCERYGVSPNFLGLSYEVEKIEKDYLYSRISQSEFVDRIEVEIINEVMLDEEMLEEEE